jgi:peptide chain release factor 3
MSVRFPGRKLAVTEGELLNFKGIPNFAPQIFRYIVNTDPLKEKQYHKGLDQLAEEGIVQIFSKPHQPNLRVIGVVGQLQLEVLQYRMEYEYGSKCDYRPINLTIAHWITSDNPKTLHEFIAAHTRRILVDIRGTHIIMSETAWQFEQMKAENLGIRFYSTSEMVESRA